MALRDLRNLTQALKILLVLDGLVILLCFWSELAQLGLLERIAADAEWTPEEADANDFRQFLIGSLALVVSITTSIVFLRWLYLSSRNAHEVTTGMRFTPGWTVGWYFVPIFTIWKPYQAMVELFRASDPAVTAQVPAFLRMWWGLWLVSIVVGNAVFRRMFRSDTVEELVTLSRVTAASYLVDAATVVAAYVLVSRLAAYQEAKFRTVSAATHLATDATS